MSQAERRKEQSNGDTYGERRQPATGRVQSQPSPARQRPQTPGSTEFLRAVTDYDSLSPRVQKIAEEVLDRRFSVTNLSEVEVWELKFLLKNDFIRIRMAFPPQGSCMQGALRKAVYGDNKTPLSDHEKNQLAQLERSTFAALKQSEDGWLLEDVIGSVTTVSRREDNRWEQEPENESLVEKAAGWF